MLSIHLQERKCSITNIVMSLIMFMPIMFYYEIRLGSSLKNISERQRNNGPV